MTLFFDHYSRDDDLIQEFAIFTTELDGLLGVLENVLRGHVDDTNFEAKRLLCALFQVQIE